MDDAQKRYVEDCSYLIHATEDDISNQKRCVVQAEKELAFQREQIAFEVQQIKRSTKRLGSRKNALAKYIEDNQ